MNWHINVNNQNVGPLSEEDIRARLKTGQISPNTPVWREGLPQWVPLGSSELMAQIGASQQMPPQMSAQVPYQMAPAPQGNPFEHYINAFKNYATFTGRARRCEFWYFFLFHCIVGVVLALVSQPLYGLYLLGAFIPILAVAVRRLHDVGKSGWFYLVPIYNLVLLVTEGTPGPNQYGHDPRAPSGASSPQQQYRNAA